MLHQSDNSDHPSTLPQPDLNPLLNPLLAKNIGRWAEVYFTNPPEKRERAVQELVRELERENPSPEDAVAPQRSHRKNDIDADHPRASTAAEAPGEGLSCPSCGYLNRARHKFCGRCGMRITAATIDGREQEEPQTNYPMPSLAPECPESPIFGVESALRWHGYRMYAGVALALVVLILGYMVWRGAQITSQASHAAPQLPLAVTNPAASAPSNPKVDASSQAPPRTAATPAAEAPAKNNRADTSPRVPVSHSAENDVASAIETGGGSEELAMARDFLNGTNGKERNPTQAVPWLWKAVAKQNAAATVLLSGMYLRGDGVARNCDQAHLLLDAAAIKGRKDAAELLRNLQAFGCQ